MLIVQKLVIDYSLAYNASACSQKQFVIWCRDAMLLIIRYINDYYSLYFIYMYMYMIISVDHYYCIFILIYYY